MFQETYVLNKKVRLLQPEAGGFRTSLDSVMLAAACPANESETVLDLGCGVGGAGLCVTWRAKVRLTGIDRETAYIELAQRNAALNQADAKFFVADIRNFTADQAFSHVILNPPYREAGTHTPSPDAIRAHANGHLEGNLSLEDWIRAAHRNLQSKGSVTIVYPASGTDKILRAFGKKFGAIEIIPLWPRAGVEAKRVIIRALKDRQSPARILPGLVLHKENGDYTDDAEKILRSGQALL